MSGKISGLQFLELEPLDMASFPSLCAICGADDFLRRRSDAKLRAAMRSIGGEDAEFSVSIFDGSSPMTLYRDVISDLSTKSLFGVGPRRLVIVERADEFVTRWRSELEDYAAQPKSSSILMLEPVSFPSNTRLAKAFEKNGVIVQCDPPKNAELRKWLDRWAQRTYQVRLEPNVAEQLLEMIGPSTGLLDQEIAKLSLAALNVANGEGEGAPGKSTARVTLAMVGQLSGNWRTRGVWELLDQVLNGDVSGTLVQLDRLLSAGESPIMILASASVTLRRFAAAARLWRQTSDAGRSMTIRDALEQVGTPPFILGKSELQLRRLGAERALRLYPKLIETDLALKGYSRMEPRMVLERFLVTLASSMTV